MHALNVALVQTELTWEAAAANCEHLAHLMHDGARGADLIVLPEMFNTGFSMDVAATAETMQGPTISWLSDCARSLKAALCGSLAILEQESVYNRMVMALPDGSLQYYDKRHLFRMGDEHQRYRAGNKRCVWAWRDWRLCPMVCYDLRFPVWSRNRGDYDVLIYVANWPAIRRNHWRHLLIARAIENQCAVIAVNRLGVDANRIDYAGDSMVIDAEGRLLSDPKAAPGVHHCRIDGTAMTHYRERFPAALDADEFSLDP